MTRARSQPLRAGGGDRICAALVWLIVGAGCLLPILWIVWQVLLNPTTLRELHLDAFRLRLIGRTVLYSVCVGLLSTLLALPAAWVLGRGRGRLAAALWGVMPVTLLMPSLVIAYGWSQLVRIVQDWALASLNLNLQYELAGFWDVSRCVWSLATWLAPAPALILGLAMRRSDSQVQQQALLDGVLRRVVVRQMLGPAIASVCIVAMLAMQEFAVYEPTGISVVATEVRMVFETGAYSAPDNPITQQFGFAASDPAAGADQPGFLPDQRARAAAAIATALPLLGIMFLLGLAALLGVRKLSAGEDVEFGSWPRRLDAPATAVAASWIVVFVTLIVPIASLVASLHRKFDMLHIWQEFSPHILGSIFIASLTGVVAATLAFAAVPRPGRTPLAVSLLSFVIGGQILAIALIRIYNQPWLEWIYNRAPLVVIAYIGRFGWIALAAAVVTWSKPWRELRDLASIDGASAMQTARYVVWPLAWPLVAASATFVLILSLSEVPATVLLAPARPQMLVPMLMTWVHMLRYDAMIEASLVMVIAVLMLGAVAMLFVRMQAWRLKEKGANPMLRRSFSLFLLAFVILPAGGCRDGSKPDAIWLTTGIGPGQVVYPRAIAYSRLDDSFYVVDREARIQHLDRSGKALAEWRTPSWAQGKPVGLSVGPDGNLWVPDTHYHRILVYSPSGELVRQWGSRGGGPGQFVYPTDVAFDSKGNVFVSEYGDNDRIQVFNAECEYLYEFGKFGEAPGDFSRPQSMVIDGDLLYVTDACNHRLQVFKTDGTFVRVMGKVGSDLGEFRFPYGLDMDSRGRLVVCEFGNNRVQLIDKETGAGLATWGFAGREPGELAYPWGIAVDQNDRVVTVDAGNNRLQVFEF